ncbi:MAG: MTH1187 family thiamine-binding protein [Nitrososphaerota archaeon]|nr:MTH1187 family thiamine-binding protein [Nitrososphaerales archaeon]MDW8044989.1 MTH1187 family thiamine-binding protein [Nitrososphaerota archaeon]
MNPEKKIVVIAEFSATPIGTGSTSLSNYVTESLKAISTVKGIRYQVTPMGTIIESEDLESIFEAVKASHNALFNSGVKRVVSILKIDDRRDKPRAMEDKVEVVVKRLKEGRPSESKL